ARRKGLAFSSLVADDVRERVVGDPDRWRQILTHLVSNAIKFTATGEVAVEVRQTSTTAITTIVRDTGIGISAEQQTAIFAAFAQADASTTRSHGGTGLGLTIAARLAEQMAGGITVRSAVGQGSEFACTVQLGVPPEAVASAAPRSLRVLVAEDNELSAQLVQELLTRSGHSARIARNGHEALAMLADDDLVLLDLHMPGLDGFEVVARIRARERETGGHVPVVALTASSRPEDRQRCLDAGMDDFIAKPIHGNALRAALARIATLRPEWIDADVLLAACDGEAAIYEKIRGALQTAVPDELAIAISQLGRGELADLRKTAHRLHGLIGAVSSSLGAIASELEDHAEAGSVPEARARVATLQAQVPALLAELARTPFESLTRWSA
ncbi:MAG TPA: response regulator, partial [Kofleriaceae bacterium]